MFGIQGMEGRSRNMEKVFRPQRSSPQRRSVYMMIGVQRYREKMLSGRENSFIFTTEEDECFLYCTSRNAAGMYVNMYR